jgi:alpha-galactosidase
VLIVNVPNTGSYVPGIPSDFAVEIPALVGGRGVQGIQTHPLPRPILAHALRDRVASVEAELYAYEHGDYEALLQTVLMDPWTRSERQARDLIGEILDLPYHKEMAAHYLTRSERQRGLFGRTTDNIG